MTLTTLDDDTDDADDADDADDSDNAKWWQGTLNLNFEYQSRSYEPNLPESID